MRHGDPTLSISGHMRGRMNSNQFLFRQVEVAPGVFVDGLTPIELWKRPKRGTPASGPRIHYILLLASGACWHSTTEFTGICSVHEAMAGYEQYEYSLIPPEYWDGARQRLLQELFFPRPWAGNDNCQHRANWIAFGERYSPTYSNLVLGALLAGGVGLAIAGEDQVN